MDITYEIELEKKGDNKVDVHVTPTFGDGPFVQLLNSIPEEDSEKVDALLDKLTNDVADIVMVGVNSILVEWPESDL